MSEFNTQGEPQMGGGGGSFDEMTPYERLWADNVDLCARLRLADERAFEQAAEIARLRSQIELMRRG